MSSASYTLSAPQRIVAFLSSRVLLLLSSPLFCTQGLVVSSVSHIRGRSLNEGQIISWVSMQIPDSCLLQNALHLENTLCESYKMMLMACCVVQEPRTHSSKKPNTSSDNNIDPTLSLESVSVPRGRAKVGQLVASSTFR
ncbi:MAG: hypothetical protein ACK55Z_37590, partial [bacterium]